MTSVLTPLPPVDRRPPHEDDSAGPKPRPQAADRHARAMRQARLALSVLGAVGDQNAALQWFIDNDGLSEDPPGSNCTFVSQQFYRDAGYPHELAPGCWAWCAAAVTLALNLAFGDIHVWQVPGVAPTYPVGTCYVPSLRASFQTAGFYEPDRTSHGQPAELRPGDVVILFGESHTGLCAVDLGDGTFLSWEGNYGDRIGLFRRSRMDLDGVGHVPWGTPAPPDPTPADPWADRFVPILGGD